MLQTNKLTCQTANVYEFITLCVPCNSKHVRVSYCIGVSL